MVINEDAVMRVLVEEGSAMTTVEIAKSVGGTKAKDVKPILDILTSKNKVSKVSVNKSLYWCLDNSPEISTQTDETDISNNILSKMVGDYYMNLLLDRQRDEILHLRLEL